jgi:hypothetical protein
MAEETSSEFPKIKKKISSYLKAEEGKITKESVLTVGAFITSAAASAALLSKTVNAATGHTSVEGGQHGNDVDLGYTNDVAVGNHTHHGSHLNQHSSY